MRGKKANREDLRDSRRVGNKLVTFHESVPNGSVVRQLLRHRVLRNDRASVGFRAYDESKRGIGRRGKCELGLGRDSSSV